MEDDAETQSVPKELSVASQNAELLTPATPLSMIPTKLSIHLSRTSEGSIKNINSQRTDSEQMSIKSVKQNIDTATKLSIHLSRTSLGSIKNINSQRADSEQMSIKSVEQNIDTAISKLEPQGKSISDHVEELTATVMKLSQTIQDPQSPILENNVDRIAKMSKMLTKEANALRQSIKSLSIDIAKIKQELNDTNKEDVNFPYHLFLIELIINKIHMKCECFELDDNNLVISAVFLGKQIVLYDSSYGKIDSFNKLNVGKSTLFAMTYDKICAIKEFEVSLQMTKEPPCSSCVTKIAESHMDYTSEFVNLREQLCKKWAEEKPKDEILCTTSTPMTKNLFYLSCCGNSKQESIGVIEVSARMSFLGKEITTAFSASPKPQGTSLLLKEDHGMSMYSCQKVEMNDRGKILLDEDVMATKGICNATRDHSPVSVLSSTPPIPTRRSFQSYGRQLSPILSPHNYNGRTPKYDEIFTKMNDNELKIRVPKSTKVERMGKYDKIQELCSCESTPYNTGDQVQFELPPDLCYPDKTHNTYTSNLKYTCDKSCENTKDRRIINVTPTNCPVPVNMEKVLHSQKDVFILKIGKKLETKDKKTDLEIELVTPKVPTEKPPEISNISTQNSEGQLQDRKKEKKADKKGKKAKDAKTTGKKNKPKKEKSKNQ